MNNNKKRTYWLGQTKRRYTHIWPKAIRDGIFCRFLRDDCRMEAAGDVISSKGVDEAGMDVRVKFGDTRLNSGQIIRWEQ